MPPTWPSWPPSPSAAPGGPWSGGWPGWPGAGGRAGWCGAGLRFSPRAYRQDARAGLATQPLAGFLRDWAKGRGVGLVLTLVPLTALILGARWAPPGWPW